MRHLSHVLVMAALFAGMAVANRYCLKQSGSTYTVEAHGCTGSPTDMVDASYTTSYELTGWDELIVTPLQMASIGRTKSFHLAGYIEGYLTYDRIWSMYANTVVPILITPAMFKWIEKQRAYMANPPQTDVAQNTTFWAMVGDLLSQLDGIGKGYNDAQPDPMKKLNATQVFWLSFQAELGDVETITMFNYSMPGTARPFGGPSRNKHRRGSSGHCSGFIRDTGDDLFMAHATWSEYNTMLRQFKVYNFGTTVAMSSYPGVIHSIDDWYMTSKRLTVQETTLEVYNNSLYRGCHTDTVSEFLRVMAANYLSDTGEDWVTFVNMKNSGTFNNQWMIVDQKLFVPNEPDPLRRIPDGTLWIYEQLPEPFARWGDLSIILRQTGCWVSYNIPFFPEVFINSGNRAMERQYGSYFSYRNYSRAEIFAREYNSVDDLDGVKRLMQYNNFHKDPFSLIPNCSGATNNTCDPPYSAMLSIAARGDLDPIGSVQEMGVLWAMGGVGQSPYGAIDAKITSHRMTQNATNMHAHIICGPSQSPGVGDLPPFGWNAPWVANNSQFSSASKLGLATVYDFPWVHVESKSPVD